MIDFQTFCSSYTFVSHKLTHTSDAFDKVARILKLPVSQTFNPGAQLEKYASLSPLPPFDTAPLKPFPIPLSPSSSASKQHKRQHQGPVFSFAGLLTHTGREIERLRLIGRDKKKEGVKVDDEAIWREVGKRFQDAAVGHLVQQIKGVFENVEEGKVEGGEDFGGPEEAGRLEGLVVSGGVASNMFLRER